MQSAPEVQPNELTKVTLASIGRSFYSARIDAFLVSDPSAILGRLSSRHVAFRACAEHEQLRAWEREIEILKSTLHELDSLVAEWWLLLEVPLLRLSKRLDAVLLAPGVVGARVRDRREGLRVTGRGAGRAFRSTAKRFPRRFATPPDLPDPVRLACPRRAAERRGG